MLLKQTKLAEISHNLASNANINIATFDPFLVSVLLRAGLHFVESLLFLDELLGVGLVTVITIRTISASSFACHEHARPASARRMKVTSFGRSAAVGNSDNTLCLNFRIFRNDRATARSQIGNASDGVARRRITRGTVRILENNNTLYGYDFNDLHCRRK